VPAAIGPKKIKIYTANTFSRSVQAGLLTITVIIDTMTNLPDEKLWGCMFEHYTSEFTAFETGLIAMCRHPYIRYADNRKKMHFSADRMP
jgi:hypothetical protein